MRSGIVKMFVLMMAVALVGAACSTKSTATMAIGSDKANDHGTTSVSGMSQFRVKADSFFFEPTVLKGTPGQKVKLEIDNETKSTLHNFSLQAQSIDQDIQARQNATVTVTFPPSGSLEFFCKYHRASGMVGELSA